MKSRVLVALSGGVDSAVAAYLLQQEGWTVEGVYMRTWQNERNFGECPWREDLESARAVATTLGIPFRIVNMIEHYKEHVVKALIEGYRNGITPNPDMLCNRHVKFGALKSYAQKEGFEILATGHYSKLIPSENEVQLWEATDKSKDQSYFLARLRQEQIQNVLFPLGNLHKTEVRQIAQKIGLPNAQRKDSQDICFLGGKITIQDFLQEYLSEQPGKIVNRAGKVLGEHRGLYRYTLGQRKGIGIPSNCDFEKYVVVGKDLEKNELIVAFESDKENGLATQTATLNEVSFIGEALFGEHSLLVKPRYRDASTPATINFLPNGRAEVHFEVTQRALAIGQTLAVYRGEQLLGGGLYC